MFDGNNSSKSKLTFKDCFRFPLSTPEARKDLIVGGLLLLFTLPFGWVCNLGHRLNVVEHLFHEDLPYFRGFFPLRLTFFRGIKAACAITVYLLPSLLLAILTLLWRRQFDAAAFVLLGIAALLFLLGIFALPGGMTYNAAFNDLSYLYRPDKAFRRALEGGALYLKAWVISLFAVALSFTGLIILGVGFFFTSVWAWQVVGYAFSRALVLKKKIELSATTSSF